MHYLIQNKEELGLKMKKSMPENHFYQTKSMYDDYKRYQDVVFFNRRINKTRFGKRLVILCGVDSEGKTVVFGVAISKDEKEEDYKYALEAFYESIKDVGCPKVMIIERNSQVRKAFEELKIEKTHGT